MTENEVVAGRPKEVAIYIVLKEIKGINRIEDFIRQAQLRNWLVKKVDVNTMIDIFNIAEEKIELE